MNQKKTPTSYKSVLGFPAFARMLSGESVFEGGTDVVCGVRTLKYFVIVYLSKKFNFRKT